MCVCGVVCVCVCVCVCVRVCEGINYSIPIHNFVSGPTMCSNNVFPDVLETTNRIAYHWHKRQVNRPCNGGFYSFRSFSADFPL